MEFIFIVSFTYTSLMVVEKNLYTVIGANLPTRIWLPFLFEHQKMRHFKILANFCHSV